MALTKLGLIAGLIGLLGSAPFAPLSAQPLPASPYYTRTLHSAPPHIVITPRPYLYRRCVERLQLQDRPSGPVLFPLTYCWWVRG